MQGFVICLKQGCLRLARASCNMQEAMQICSGKVAGYTTIDHKYACHRQVCLAPQYIPEAWAKFIARSRFTYLAYL